MNEIIIRKALLTDAEFLVKMRIDFLNDDPSDTMTDAEQNSLTMEFSEYLQNHLNKDFIAFLACKGETVVSSAFIAIQKRNAIPPFVSEQYAILTNVFTYPAYRKQGIATRIINQLIQYADDQKVSCIELTAKETKMAYYKKFGFCEKELHGQIMCLCCNQQAE